MAKPASYSPSSSSPLHSAAVSNPSARRSRPARRFRTTKISRSFLRAPSAAVLAALATLVSAAPPPVDGATITTEPLPVARGTSPLPDVPEFLCPALLTQPSLPPLAASSSSANTYSVTPSAAQTVTAPTPITRRQRQKQAHYLSQDFIEPEAVADCSENSHFQDDRQGVANPVQTQSVTRATANTNADDVFVHTSPTPASPNGRRKYRSITRSTTAPKFSSRLRSRTHARGARPQSVSDSKLRLHERRDADGDSDSNTDADAITTPQCTESFTSRTIPDRYELGDDGRWYKLSVWSSCSLCECEAPDVDGASNNEISTTGVHSDVSDDLEEDNVSTSEDPSIAASTGSSEATPSAVSPVLPDGWEPQNASAVYKVPLIVVASVLIAAAVTLAVWFVFFWRRRRRFAKQEARARDLEKRRRLAGDGSDSEESMDEDENMETRRARGRRCRENVLDDPSRRGQTPEGKGRKRWARAAEEWKAHVRWIHRRKRGRAGIVDGLRRQNDAMASGVSLAPSLASSQSTRRTPRQTLHGDDPNSLRGEDRSIASALVVTPGSEGEGDSMSGSRIRANGQDEGVLRETENSSEGRRSMRIRDQRSTQNSGRDDGEVGIRARSRPRIGLDIPIAASSATLNSDSAMEESGASEAYDRPPPDILSVEREICADNDGDVENEVQGPPAYRPRRSVDGEDIRTTRNIQRRVRRDEKRASAPQYVPAPEDCAPYSSGDEDSENDRERRTTLRRNADRLQANMHVAVDDKHALAQLATYASAPPSSSSLPVSSSPPSGPPSAESSILLANVPPEPEWLYDYPLSDDDAVGDSPGAGPGPSTVSARSASPSPSSSRCHSPSRPVVSRGRLPPSFPAPPKPVSSQLVYAPADAGLLAPSLELDSSLGASLGFEELGAEFAPSAPPFDEYAVGAPPLEGKEVDVLDGASAPPLFPEDEDEDGKLYEYASAPPVGSAEIGCSTQVTGAELGNDRSRGIAYSAEESALEVPAEPGHVEKSDRNAVPSAVR